MKYIIPEFLETERLNLRMFRETDWRDMYEYFSDPECMRFTSGRAFSENESWQKVAALSGHWNLRGYGSYALEEKSTGRVLGVAGLDYPLEWPEPEIQWGLSKAHWGKGYASEAVKAIKKMTAESIPGLPLISLIYKNNNNSINLAKAVGATFEKEYELRNESCLIFRH
ncbi:MAG TPA: GNAT family N-acetyltransferase [Chryseolinea sp.]|nr:GNAT family N-acetyltransferase [Chryseolinea sp.]